MYIHTFIHAYIHTCASICLLTYVLVLVGVSDSEYIERTFWHVTANAVRHLISIKFSPVYLICISHLYHLLHLLPYAIPSLPIIIRPLLTSFIFSSLSSLPFFIHSFSPPLRPHPVTPSHPITSHLSLTPHPPPNTIVPLTLTQVESLGGNFLSVPYVEDGSGQGGYAKEMSQGYKDAEVRVRVRTYISIYDTCFHAHMHTYIHQYA